MKIEARYIEIDGVVLVMPNDPNTGQYTAVMTTPNRTRTATGFSKEEALFNLIEQFFSRPVRIESAKSDEEVRQ